MKKFRTIAALGVGALALAAGASTASAATLTVSATTAQSGFAGTTLPDTPLTDGAYDFAGQNFNQLISIDTISITLTVNDGDTGLGEIDHNNWHLALDGIDTGLVLNGFSANNIVTLTLNNPNNSGALLAALQSDGMLVGSIIDADTQTPNFIALPGLIDTTLDLTGTLRDNGGGPNPIPLPAAALVAPLAAGVAGAFARRFRKTR